MKDLEQLKRENEALKSKLQESENRKNNLEKQNKKTLIFN